MTRTVLISATLLTLVLPTTASANDIIDFLRAVSGPSRHSDRHDRGHDHGRVALHPVSHRGHGRTVHDRHDHRGVVVRPDIRSIHRPIGSRPNVSFSLSFGNSGRRVAALPAYPPVPVVAPSQLVIPPPVVAHAAHRIGEIVTCAVPLETCVHVHDLCEVAPNAVPTVVAVRNPHLGRRGSRGCVESVSYVQVLAPPCPPRRVRVSPCGTRLRLDYGRYDIHIESCNDVIEIDYDN